MSAQGRFLMDRSVFGHWVWERGAKEWTWLIGHAAFTDTMIRFSGHRIPVRRGQYATTFRKLATEWGRSLTWVNDFLHDLESNGMIRLDPLRLPSLRGTRKGTRDGTLITIVNYHEYQKFPNSLRPEPNVERNTTGDIEERSHKNETAAPVASDGSNQTCHMDANLSGSESDPRIDEIRNLHHRITGCKLRDTQAARADITELFVRLSFPAVRLRVAGIAERQKAAGNPPKWLGYYCKVIREDIPATECRAADPALLALNSRIGNGPARPSDTCELVPQAPRPEPEEPELGAGYTRFKALIGGLSELSEETEGG